MERASAFANFRTFLLAARHYLTLITRRAQQESAGDRFLNLTEGGSFERTFAAFGDTPKGQTLLERRPDTLALLRDRHQWQELPAGSLGRCYLEFLQAHGLDEEIYLEYAAAAGARYAGDGARAWLRTRVNAMHDLRHLLAGYGPDVRGEMCLLSFRFGQLRHPGALVLAATAAVYEMARLRSGAIKAAVEAYRRGRGAKLLDLFPWELEMGGSLAVLRASLGLTAPQSYYGSVAVEAWLEPCQERLELAAAPAIT